MTCITNKKGYIFLNEKYLTSISFRNNNATLMDWVIWHILSVLIYMTVLCSFTSFLQAHFALILTSHLYG